MTFTEEVFENQMRLPGGQWIGMSEGYTDVVCVCVHALYVCMRDIILTLARLSEWREGGSKGRSGMSTRLGVGG